MNYHEALGRYTELSEQIAAERTRRHALLHNLAGIAGRSSRDRNPVDYSALRALLDGAEAADTKVGELLVELHVAAEACNKPVPAKS